MLSHIASYVHPSRKAYAAEHHAIQWLGNAAYHAVPDDMWYRLRSLGVTVEINSLAVLSLSSQVRQYIQHYGYIDEQWDLVQDAIRREPMRATHSNTQFWLPRSPLWHLRHSVSESTSLKPVADALQSEGE